MWKIIRLTCLGIFLLFMDSNGVRGTDDVESSEETKENLAKQEFQESGGDIDDIDKNELGFNYTEAEMKKLKIWPGGVIPYYLDTLSFDAEYRRTLDRYFSGISTIAGVQFLKLQRPPTDENSRWVLFLNRRGVLRSEGYTTNDFTYEGVQKVVLGYDCLHNGEIYMTTLAILGVPPQHNSPDRDDYITVHYDNILPDKKHLFNVLKNDEWLFHDINYDYRSAGHYGQHKYAIKGFATIEPKHRNLGPIGEGVGLSTTDTLKIRMIYNYISKLRSKLLQKSDCLKMFKPGPKFDDFEPNEMRGIKPRPKPDKYLGIPDDNDNKGDNDDKIVKEHQKKTTRYRTKKSRKTNKPGQTKSTKKTKTTKQQLSGVTTYEDSDYTYYDD